MVTTRKVKTMQGDNRGEKTLDGGNNLHYMFAPTERRGYNTCSTINVQPLDRITDKTLQILFPMENVRSEAALLCVICSRRPYVHRFS